MYSTYSSMRHILIDNYNVSSSVGSDNIKVGYQRVITNFPCISLFRVGLTSWGRLGYIESPVGSRDRNANTMMQVDIFHNSVEELEILDDYVVKAIVASGQTGQGFRLMSNPSGFDETYDCYRTVQTWLCSEIVQD
jgi:hypothetical protein